MLLRPRGLLIQYSFNDSHYLAVAKYFRLYGNVVGVLAQIYILWTEDVGDRVMINMLNNINGL